jgi:palmitoyl-protein thioesterase
MYSLYSIAAFVALASSLPSLKPKPKPLPLIIWHGLGDRYDAEGLQSTGKLAEEVHPGTYVYYIRTDDDGSADRTNTFFGNVTTQLAEVCEAIHNEPGLVDPDNRTRVRADALGFSQGGQFLRGLVEACEGLSVRSLVTFGSQHNGIAEFQECGTFDFLCKGATGLIKDNAWTDYVQGKVVPAQYYRTVNETTGLGSDEYLKHSNFLAHINNEREVKVERYAEKIATLDKFVMYVFNDDVTVVPKETGWFAEVNATSGEVTPLRERKMYKEDWLGLQRLDKKGGLVYRNTTGKHMQLSDKDLIDAFTTYFGPERDDEDVVEEDYDSLGFCDFLRAARESALAGQAGDELLRQYWLDEANYILEQMCAKGYVMREVDSKSVAVFDEDEDEIKLKLVEDQDDLEEDSWFEANVCWERAADDAQAWWDSLPWWKRWKFEWEAVWLPWWRGEAEKLSNFEKRIKAKGDL